MPWFSSKRELGSYVGSSVSAAEDGAEYGDIVGVENSVVDIDWRAGHRFSDLDKNELATTFVSAVYGDVDAEGRQEFIEGFESATEEESKPFWKFW